MKMGMMEQGLAPRMQYGEEADLRAQTFGVSSDGGQGLGGGSEQNAVDQLFVLVSDGSNLCGNREDDMEIVCRENFGPSFFDPLRTSERLALWTVAVTAAVVAGALVVTVVAPLEMAAAGGRAAHPHPRHYTPPVR